MSDEQSPQAVPENGAPAPTTQTPPASSPEPTKAPEIIQKPPQPAYLTRDEASALFREQLTQFSPELANQLKQAMTADFASKTEIQKVSQSAADKTFAKAMKKLAPELRGIDKAAKAGLIDQTVADQAKMKLLSDTASEMDAEEPEPAPAQPTPQPAAIPQPQQDLRQETQKAAQRLLGKAGLTWDDVRADMLTFRNAQGRDMGLDEFTEFIGGKMVVRGTQDKESEWMKKYEEKISRVKAADGAGATTPPPEGTSPAYKPKATLDDANDLGEVLTERFGLPKN